MLKCEQNPFVRAMLNPNELLHNWLKFLTHKWIPPATRRVRLYFQVSHNIPYKTFFFRTTPWLVSLTSNFDVVVINYFDLIYGHDLLCVEVVISGSLASIFRDVRH